MHRVLCSLFVLASLATGAARADVTFQYTAVPSSTTVQAGSTVTVSIYLTETITPISNASNSNLQNQSIIALDGGVVAAGFFVNTVGTTSASSITALANNVTSGNANGTNFDGEQIQQRQRHQVLRDPGVRASVRSGDQFHQRRSELLN
jgi:hypothetical protein